VTLTPLPPSWGKGPGVGGVSLTAFINNKRRNISSMQRETLRRFSIVRGNPYSMSAPQSDRWGGETLRRFSIVHGNPYSVNAPQSDRWGGETLRRCSIGSGNLYSVSATQSDW
jgi:hypothetical protein